MFKIIIGLAMIGLSYLGFRYAFKETDKDKAKSKLTEELSRSETLNVKSEYLDVKASNNKVESKLETKEKKIES